MNFKSLLQRDMSELKNVKLDDVRSSIQSKPMTGVRILLVVVAIGGLVFGWSNGNKRKEALINELGQKQKKLEVFQDLQKIKSEYDLFFKKLPQSIDQDTLIKEVSELAERKKIQIISFSPSERKFNDLVKGNALELAVTAESYDDLADFIESVENSSYLIRLERWSGRMLEVASKENQHEMKKIVDARLEILGLLIKQDSLSVR